MFEEHKAKKAAKEYQEALAAWNTKRDGYAVFLQLAQSFNGEPSSEIMLKSGEALFCRVTNASLVEERRVRGTTRAVRRASRSPSGAWADVRCATGSVPVEAITCRALRPPRPSIPAPCS